MQKSRLSLTLIQRKKTKVISTPPFPHQSDQQMEPPEELEGVLRSQHSADQTLMKPRIQHSCQCGNAARSTQKLMRCGSEARGGRYSGGAVTNTKSVRD